jgi:hypothetical protein
MEGSAYAPQVALQYSGHECEYGNVGLIFATRALTHESSEVTEEFALEEGE